MTERADVVVIGAGLTGLALAFRLSQKGRSVRVLEARDVVGGNLRTRSTDSGYLLELGPNSFGDGSASFMQLARDAGLGTQLVGAPDSADKRWLFRNGRLIEVSNHPLKFFLSGLLPLGGRLRLMKEPFVKPRPADAPEESLAEFCDRRLGRAAREKLLTPVVSGIYAGDPEELGAESAFPRMIALEREHGSLIRAAMKGSGPPKRGRLSSFQDGLEALPQALAAPLGDAVRTGHTVESITRTEGGWNVDGIAADHVVIASPARATARLLADLLPEVAAELNEVISPPMAAVHVGVRKDAVGEIPPGFGFLVPRGEGMRILGCIFSSRLFPGRAPDGHELMTIFSGGRLDPEAPSLDDDAIRAYVLADLTRAFGRVDDVDHFSVYRWERAIPQYVVGHKDRLARIDAALAEMPGLHLAGNWRGGIAMPACVDQADALAERFTR